MTLNTADLNYIQTNQLDQLFNPHESHSKLDVFDSVSGKVNNAFPPDIKDLLNLHRLIRQRKPFTVMEFGIGFSTLVIADALDKNEAEWNALKQKPAIRNRYAFQLFSVDASQKWIEHTQKQIPKHLMPRVTFHYSEVKIGQHNGQLCHFYQNLPNIIADFIYLDGPSPKDVQGSINGLSFACDERTVMAADLLLMESTFLPGTYILVDGRSNNSRFLQRHFTRDYHVVWDEQQDTTSFELNEPRLGRYNILANDYL